MIKKIISAMLTVGILISCGTFELPAHSSVEIVGDVNGDTRVDADDLILLERYLLNENGARLDRWEAGDLCTDGVLDVYDLCIMRKLVCSSPLDALKGLSYDEAVELGYIDRSEYTHQITLGLKEMIEERNGRPIDYSVDRFYRVNTNVLGIDGICDYIYEPYTGEIFELTGITTPRNRAGWYWKGTKAAEYGIDDDMEKQSEFLDALEYYGITEIYYSIGANKLVKNKDTVARFVKNAYERDMKVYLLTGENTWLYEDTYEKSVYNIFDRAEEYNSLVDYDSRLAGVSYDAEFWTNSEYDWKNNAESRRLHVKHVETVQKYADEKDLSVSFCLPFWIARYDYTDLDGNTQNVYDSITKTARETIIMAYRDKADSVEKLIVGDQTNAEHPLMYYNEKNGCNIEVAVQIDENKEGDFVSYYEEEQELAGYVLGDLDKLETSLSPYDRRTTFAIHHCITMYENYRQITQNTPNLG